MAFIIARVSWTFSDPVLTTAQYKNWYLPKLLLIYSH